MADPKRHTKTIQLLTVLGYQTLAMGFMLIGASWLADWSAASDPVLETAATVECSPDDAIRPAATSPGDFLDLTFAWVLD